MWKYIRRYFPFAILAGLFMIGEVSMDLIQPGYMSQIVDEGILGIHNGGVSDLMLIWHLGIQMILLVIIGGLCGSLNNVFVHFSGQNIGNEIRKDCFRHIMNDSFQQIDEFGTGSLVTRVTNDITQVQNFVSQFVRGMIRTSLLMFGSIFCMYQLNHQFGIIVLCAFPLIVGCLIFFMVKANPFFTRLQKQLDELNEMMQEDLTGMRVIKAFVKEIYEKKRFQEKNNQLTKIQLHILIVFAFMNPIMNALMYIVVALIFVVGSIEVNQGLATPGAIMAAMTYTTQLLNGILMLIMLFQNISKGLASWKRLKEILESDPELKDGDDHQTIGYGDIEFQDVSFAYPGSQSNVLEHISFQVHQGETIGIMGATGSGKSTLVHLIPRFYDVQKGAIYIDGKNVKDYSQKYLREKIAIVLQKSEIFSMSIKDNILWGDAKASDDRVCEAAQIAQIDDYISSMPDGYETFVEEQGASLSGGQKQRLSIARAILKSPEILIFDDSTSALDLKTEAQLYESIQKIYPQTTKLIVAQRIASIRYADRIIVLDNGHIIAMGSHDELMKTCQIYQDIYYSQLGEKEKVYF